MRMQTLPAKNGESTRTLDLKSVFNSGELNRSASATQESLSPETPATASGQIPSMTNHASYRQPLRIICADDNTELVELIAESLQFYGYRVEWVFDGADALEIIAPNPDKFDLLITDMQMPKLDGYDLIVKSREAGFRGKVIVFAGALSPQDRERLGQLSVEAIIDKPANHRQLIGVVARIQTELWEQANADAA